jgi:hypothetical protein
MADDGSAPRESRRLDSRAFYAGAVLLVLAILLCGVFAGLAGKKIGNEHVDFAIAFAFLGLVTLGIFGLAWVDATTRGPDQNERQH